MPAIIPLAVAAAGAIGGAIAGHESASGAEQAASDTSSGAVKAAQIQSDASTQNAKTAADSAAQALAYSRQQSQVSLDQYNQQQQRLQPYRNLGSFALGQAPSAAPNAITLPDLPASGTTANSGTTPTGSASSMTSGQSGTNYQPLIAALNQGQSPQAVIDQFNTSQGLKTGSSYAWRSIPTAPGGGVVEVPGGAYLAPGPNGVWGYTPGSDGGGGSAASAATAGPVKLNYTPTNLSGGNAYTPTTGTLTPPPIQPYRSLSQIGGVQ